MPRPDTNDTADRHCPTTAIPASGAAMPSSVITSPARPAATRAAGRTAPRSCIRSTTAAGAHSSSTARVDYVELSDRVDNSSSSVAAPFYVNGGKQIGLSGQPDLEPDRLCSLHGPVWPHRRDRRPARIVSLLGPPAVLGMFPIGTTTPANKRKYSVDTFAAARAGRFLRREERSSLSVPSLPFGSKGGPLVLAARGLRSFRTWLTTRSIRYTSSRCRRTTHQRALVDALDEPALVVRAASSASPIRRRASCWAAIEGRDMRLAIRHPQALEHILAAPCRRHRRDRDRRAGPLVAPADPRPRPWRIILVRMIDRSEFGFGRKDAGRFRRQRQPRAADALVDGAGLCRDTGRGRRPPAELRTNFGRTIRDEAGACCGSSRI